MIQIFLLANVSAFYGDYADRIETVLIIYLIMTLITIRFTTDKPIKLGGPIEFLTKFSLIFLISGILLSIIPDTLTAKIIDAGFMANLQLTSSFAILHGLVIAYTEEIIFRGYLPTKIGVTFSNIIFGLFHWAVYSSTPLIIMFLILLSFIWSFIKFTRFELEGSIAAHTAWNYKALGLLDKIFFAQ